MQVPANHMQLALRQPHNECVCVVHAHVNVSVLQ